MQSLNNQVFLLLSYYAANFFSIRFLVFCRLFLLNRCCEVKGTAKLMLQQPQDGIIYLSCVLSRQGFLPRRRKLHIVRLRLCGLVDSRQ